MGYYDKKAKESAETVPILRDWMVLTFKIAGLVYAVKFLITMLSQGG